MLGTFDLELDLSAFGFTCMCTQPRSGLLIADGEVCAVCPDEEGDGIMSSAGEAEVGALYFNCKDAMMLRTALEEMGHPQPATPIQTDNSFASGFANKQIKQRRSKAIDMRFYWIQDRVDQGQFKIYWAKGTDNLADYFTKHFNGKYHRHVRRNYLVDLHKRDYEQHSSPID